MSESESKSENHKKILKENNIYVQKLGHKELIFKNIFFLIIV